MIKIRCITYCQSAFFAAEELKKYMMMMCPDFRDIPIFYEDGSDGIKLGLINDFGIGTDGTNDIFSEDEIYIDTDAHGGIIAGGNERSILLAVYEYLRANGIRWLFVGKDGEYIPQKDSMDAVKLRKRPFLRCRGVATEGAPTRENVTEFIDFATKNGLNTYMTEFDTSYIYHQQYYRHPFNKLKLNEDISNETALSWKMEQRAEISKRSFMYHDVGHGWTAEPFGIRMMSGLDGYADDFKDIPDELKKHYALIDGKRGLYDGFAINTNLCMSNPETRKIVAKSVTEYAEKNRSVNYLHVWLADACNNHCECSECIKKIPTDWYVCMLNDIDEELTKRRLDTKIVFIMYHETLWAPQSVSLNNKDRFVMLFAPISRVYTESYDTVVSHDAVKPFILNNYTRPCGMAENLAYLKKWHDIFGGDITVFEYHFHWLIYRDFGGFNVARSVYNDVHSFKNVSVNGVIENMTLRCAFPTGLAFYTLARASFDGELSFDDIAKDYFTAAFGDDWQEAYNYYSRISDLFDYEYFTKLGRGGITENDTIPSKMADIINITKSIRGIAERNIKNPVRCISVSWQMMLRFCDFIVPTAEAHALIAKGDYDSGYKKFFDTIDYLASHEDEMQKYMDMSLYTNLNRRLFEKKDFKDTMN